MRRSWQVAILRNSARLSNIGSMALRSSLRAGDKQPSQRYLTLSWKFAVAHSIDAGMWPRIGERTIARRITVMVFGGSKFLATLIFGRSRVRLPQSMQVTDLIGRPIRLQGGSGLSG